MTFLLRLESKNTPKKGAEQMGAKRDILVMGIAVIICRFVCSSSPDGFKHHGYKTLNAHVQIE